MEINKKNNLHKAVFLDRDGVLIRERGEYTYKMVDVQINEGVVSFLQEITKRGYLAIVISNQGGIPQGIYNKLDVDKIHHFLNTYFLRHQITLTEIYYCPHHQKTGRCFCRKPDSMMIEKALHMHRIEAKKSYMIGDTQRDVDAAVKAGIHPIKIEANQNLLTIIKEID